MTKILFLFFLTSIVARSQETQTDLSKLNLSGRVKIVKSVLYDAVVKNDSVMKGDEIKTNKRFFRNTKKHITFNESGFITEEKNNYQHQKKTYNTNNKMVTCEYIDSNLMVSSWTAFIYNHKNQLIKQYWYDQNNKIDYKMRMNYKKGKLVYQVENDLESNDKYQRRNTYDNLGYIIETVDFENDSLMYRMIYTNDSLGRKIRSEEYSSGDNRKKTSTYEYNRSGLLVKIVNYNSKNIQTSKITYTYDIQHNLVEENEFVDDLTTIRQYNLQGDEILSVNTFSKEAIFEYVYTYDDNKNWTKKISYFNGTPTEIEEREFIYY